MKRGRDASALLEKHDSYGFFSALGEPREDPPRHDRRAHADRDPRRARHAFDVIDDVAFGLAQFPEPGVLGLLGLSFALLGIRRRRSC